MRKIQLAQVLINLFSGIRGNNLLLRPTRSIMKKPHFQKITFLFLNEDATFAAAQAGEG